MARDAQNWRPIENAKPSHIQLDGLDITSDTAFDSIRRHVEKAGFEITEDQNVISAKKVEITIFIVETTNKIERIEAWCS